MCRTSDTTGIMLGGIFNDIESLNMEAIVNNVSLLETLIFSSLN